MASLTYDELLAERQILRDQVGPHGESGVDDGPNEPQKQHRHLLSLLDGSRCRSILGWLSLGGSTRQTRFLVGTGIPMGIGTAVTRNVPKLDRRIHYVKPRDFGTIQ